MPSQYTLSPEAVSEIDAHLKNKDLISAYQVVNREMAGTDYSGKTWFNLAEGINGGVGFASAYIRSYTTISEVLGDISEGGFTPLTSQQLQHASDLIATTVLQNIVDAEGVLPEEHEIYRDDATKAIEYLNLNFQEWGGAVAAIIGAIDYRGKIDLTGGEVTQTMISGLAAFDAMVIGGYLDYNQMLAKYVLDGLNNIGHFVGQNFPLPDEIYNFFTQAMNWAPPPARIDPLVLDLDGDGIETIAQSGWNSVLFDHNGDGQKTGTGWLSGNDGFLTLDKNNNGQIDNGNELFGDNSQLSNGGVAADGYAALADIDSNQDGVIDAIDTDFTNLRVWQDINQDGISQASELKTLAQLGIASLSTAGVVSGQTQNGNTVTHTGTYTKTDGSTGQTGNLDLASSVFNTEYTETTTLSAVDAARADMHGAGRVRNLRHAAATSDSCRWGKKLITIHQAA